jgi:hypothetical protein
MLGSNPTADSVDSTDRNGDVSASPFHLLSLSLVASPTGIEKERLLDANRTPVGNCK